VQRPGGIRGFLPVRLLGAALLLAAGGIHLYLWVDGYRTIELIGPSFLANAVLATLLALALLVVPSGRLPWVAAAGALVDAGTVGALLLTLTVGFLGFSESWSAPLVVPSLIVEGAGVVLLGGFAARQLLQHRASRRHSASGQVTARR
jgi:hypothetical protein